MSLLCEFGLSLNRRQRGPLLTIFSHLTGTQMTATGSCGELYLGPYGEAPDGGLTPVFRILLMFPNYLLGNTDILQVSNWNFIF